MNARYNGRVGLVLLCLVLAAGSVRAQLTGFEVVASTPATGATGVASETTVSFSFSGPLPDSLLEAGLDSLLDLGIGVHPCDQILVGGSSPCEQVAGGTLSEDGRTLSFQVTHLAQTTYTWTVPELVVSESEVALRAFVLQYATGEALGGVTVDGMVMLELAGGEEAFRVAPGETALSGWMELPRMLTRPRVTGREQPVPSLLDPIVQAVHRPALHKRGASPLQQMDPAGMIVTLSDRYGNPAGAGVVTAEGTFRITNVIDGWYVVEGFLVHYDRTLGRLRIGFAMLDEDMDGEADSIQVSGEDVSGLMLMGQGFQLDRITAAQQVAAASEMAALMAGGSASLSGIASASLPLLELVEGIPDGKALLWVYLFTGGGEDPQIVLMVQGSSGTLLPLPLGAASELGLTGPFPVLPTSFTDTDVAVAAAEAGGGADFRAAANNEVVVGMLGGLFTALSEVPEFVYEDPAIPVWVIAYLHLGYLADSLGSVVPAKQEMEVGHVFYVDMQDGSLLGDRSMVRATAVEPIAGETPRLFALEPNYPNPFRRETAVPFSLARSGPVVVEVFNLLGQRVATLVDEVPPAGRYVVRWVADGHPSGLYVVRLQASGHQFSRVVLYQR